MGQCIKIYIQKKVKINSLLKSKSLTYSTHIGGAPLSRVQSPQIGEERCKVKTNTLSNMVNSQKFISQFPHKNQNKKKKDRYMGVPYHIRENGSKSRSLKDANSDLD